MTGRSKGNGVKTPSPWAGGGNVRPMCPGLPTWSRNKHAHTSAAKTKAKCARMLRGWIWLQNQDIGPFVGAIGMFFSRNLSVPISPEVPTPRNGGGVRKQNWTYVQVRLHSQANTRLLITQALRNSEMIFACVASCLGTRST